MKKSDLKELIKEEIKKKFSLYELFGLSKKEKEQKYIKEKLEQAKKEIDNYNFNRIFKQPSDNKNSLIVQNLIDAALEDASHSLPTVKLLIPDLFKNTGAFTTVADLNGKSINGIIPDNFWFLAKGQRLSKDEEAKEKMKQELENFTKTKYSL